MRDNSLRSVQMFGIPVCPPRPPAHFNRHVARSYTRNWCCREHYRQITFNVVTGSENRSASKYTTQNVLRIISCLWWNNLEMAAIQRLIGSLTPLLCCDCITWVTHKLLRVVVASNWTVWDIIMIWSKFWNLNFWGSGGTSILGVYFFDTTERVLPIVHIWYRAMKFKK